MEKFTNNRRI